MIVEISHVLSEEAALQRIRKAIEELVKSSSKHVEGYHSHWENRSGKITCLAGGFKVTANLGVTPNKVIIEGNLPWAFQLFKKQIVDIIKEKVQKTLI